MTLPRPVFTLDKQQTLWLLTRGLSYAGDVGGGAKARAQQHIANDVTVKGIQFLSGSGPAVRDLSAHGNQPRLQDLPVLVHEVTWEDRIYALLHFIYCTFGSININFIIITRQSGSLMKEFIQQRHIWM